MNRKKGIVALGVVLFVMAGVSGCGINRKLTNQTAESAELKLDVMPDVADSAGTISSDMESEESPQLTALADSLEEAQEIADLYGIELDSYAYGVASYFTDKDISELINMGMEQGYPTLAPNNKLELHTDQSTE